MNQALPDYNAEHQRLITASRLAQLRIAELEAQVVTERARADGAEAQVRHILTARSAADREIGMLTGACNELQRQLDECVQLIGTETPISALTLAQTWRAEKAHMQDCIADLQAAYALLTARRGGWWRWIGRMR